MPDNPPDPGFEDLGEIDRPPAPITDDWKPPKKGFVVRVLVFSVLVVLVITAIYYGLQYLRKTKPDTPRPVAAKVVPQSAVRPPAPRFEPPKAPTPSQEAVVQSNARIQRDNELAAEQAKALETLRLANELLTAVTKVSQTIRPANPPATRTNSPVVEAKTPRPDKSEPTIVEGKVYHPK